jgi:prephenate dehydrogenase
MWTELFLDNKENLVKELDFFINSVKAYRDAISNDNADALKALLAEGRKIKEEVDRK